jgi:NAD(P)-dependent dehydrogenase (short-subunit alcohol dehydrogenase family)
MTESRRTPGERSPQADDESAASAMPLSGRVAVVTGAGSGDGPAGVGSAIATTLARAGARVTVVDVDETRARHTATNLGAEGLVAFPVTADVADESKCKGIIDLAVTEYGQVDVLVNNVATAQRATAPVHEIDSEDWDRVLAINLRSAVLMTKHALPTFMARSSGVVVNIASIAGVLSVGSPAYSASKAGLIALTRDTAVLYGRYGVRANALAVGHIGGHMRGTSTRSDDVRTRRRLVGPLAVEGTAWDVASVALFLAGPGSRLITGQCIGIDAGTTALAPLMATSPLMLSDAPPDRLDARTLGLR